jgi:thioesterase domain-containing protein/acyl carrier protein
MLTADPQALSALKELRLLLLGGEALPVSLAEQLIKETQAEIHNMYGPTETTIWSTSDRVENGNAVSIGRPIANTEIYLLDRNLQLVPIGVIGEMYIGGAGVVRGYYNRPELTAERFIRNPFNGDTEARLYRTGDLARYLPNGNIEFLGRADFQVKIRGHRIELGEIESAVEQHPDIKECVVVSRQDSAGETGLVAYVVGRNEPAPTVSELRDFVKEKLPEYMIPSGFVTLKALPLTPNGKVDRNALPRRELERPELKQKFVSPSGVLETKLARIWETVLGHAPIGRQDDFFELGGHSLRAVQLVVQIKEMFGKTLPVSAVFHAPTIEQMSEILGKEDLSERWASVAPLQADGTKPPFFFLAGETHFGDRLGTDQPVYRVVYQDLDRERPFNRIEEMAAHAIKSIKRIQPYGPYYLGGHSQGGIVAFEMAQQLQHRGEAVALLALCECWTNNARPSKADTSPTYRLLQRTAFYFRRARRVGARQEIAHLFGGLRNKTHKAGWAPQRGLLSHTESGHRAAIFEALRRYMPQPYSGRIAVIRCSERVPWRDYDTFDGWGKIAKEGVELYEVPGTHTGMYKEPNVSVLVKTLGELLSRAQGETRHTDLGQARDQRESLPHRAQSFINDLNAPG